MKKILIVEDDPAILLGLESALEDEYEIMTASDGLIGFHDAKKKNPALIILDIMLPNKNGIDICKDLRKEGYGIPILMLTSKKEEEDKISGLETGADDYMTKPFSVGELKARIKTILRRTAGTTGKEPPKEIETYEFDNVKLDFVKLEAEREQIKLDLSVKEFQILKYFIEHKSQVISRDKLLDDVWGYDNFPTTRTVDNYILSLRKKIEDDPANPKHLLTIHTVGYKFVC